MACPRFDSALAALSLCSELVAVFFAQLFNSTMLLTSKLIDWTALGISSSGELVSTVHLVIRSIHDLPLHTSWFLHNSPTWIARVLLSINGTTLRACVEWYLTHEPTRIPMAVFVSLTPWIIYNLRRKSKSIRQTDDMLYKAKKVNLPFICLLE